MPAAYLTPLEAQARLADYRINGTPNARELEIASDEIDAKSGWIGTKYLTSQVRAFPRSVAIQDEGVGAVPGRILDWVALRAFQLSEDRDDAPIKEEKIDTIYFQYSGKGRISRVRRLMKNLLSPYRIGGGGGRIVAS